MSFLHLLCRLDIYMKIRLNVYDKNGYRYIDDTVYNLIVDKEDKYLVYNNYIVSLIRIENNKLVISINEIVD